MTAPEIMAARENRPDATKEDNGRAARARQKNPIFGQVPARFLSWPGKGPIK
ncbi:hypothetical protein [Hymenobacter lapidarius]|uniref:hypothetical protein n=1 Tax=Hymenobacter lapidarius TaxID=1908237 RepID=UPI0013012660|nr:hypothetical protein [Hymenobacter lapidarius]